MIMENSWTKTVCGVLYLFIVVFVVFRWPITKEAFENTSIRFVSPEVECLAWASGSIFCIQVHVLALACQLSPFVFVVFPKPRPSARANANDCL